MEGEGQASQSLPPIPDDPECSKDECRLWIGNIDSRVTEFALLKILQKFGTMRKFDFLYYKTGTEQGKPRGYCFATYSNKEEAEKARKSLNGKLALSKKLVVRTANPSIQHEDAYRKQTQGSAGSSSSTVQNISAETKIRAIEAKLKLMENEVEYDISSGNHQRTSAAARSGSSFHTHRHKHSVGNAQKHHGAHRNSKPYERHKP